MFNSCEGAKGIHNTCLDIMAAILQNDTQE